MYFVSECTFSQALAQVCAGTPGLIANGSFEDPDVTQPTPPALQSFGTVPNVVRIYAEADVPGWDTTAADDRIELWRSGFGGVDSFTGNQHAELNANVPGAFFQDLATTPSSTVLWSFAHRGRAGVDTAEVLIGPPGGPLDSQGTFSTGNADWDVKRGSYVVPAGQAVTRFQFLTVSTASGSPSIGNFIDEVRIAPDCDYGDAPTSFPVMRANNGAAHLQQTGAFLGTAIDGETDAIAVGTSALGDDALGLDDEDGVVFVSLPRGISSPVEITASVAGFVNLWVDLDGDGDWQADERLLTDAPVSAGAQNLSIAIPFPAVAGTSFSRVRYTTDNPLGSIGPGGDWPNGEVEDYVVTITTLPAQLDALKTVSVFDPTNAGLFAIPGNDVVYTIAVSNIGAAATDTDTIFLVDALPSELIFFNGDANGPGPGTSNVNFFSADPNITFDALNDVGFSDQSVPPADFSACSYSPASGLDPNVNFICFNPKGILPASITSPSFTVSFRARIR